MNESNDYEQERLKNIKENERLMKELGVMGGSSAIGGPSPKRTTPTKPKKKPTTPKKKADVTPTRIMPSRSSARLAGHEADSETLKRKYEEEAEEARKVAEAAKRARHGQFDLSGMTGGELEEEAIAALEATLNGLAANKAQAAELVDIKQEKKRRSGKQEDEAQSQERTELEEVLNRMTLKSVAKVTPKRVYSMAYHPSMDKDLVFVGDKEGFIGVWDAAPIASSSTSNGVKKEVDDDEEEQDAGETFPEGKAWTLQVHGRSPVTCIKFDPVDHNSVFSCSYDSTVRKLDLSSGKSDEVWAGEEDVLLSIFDVLSPQTHPSAYIDTPNPSLDERSLWIADHRGGLLHIDLREKTRRGNNTRRWQVCEKKIGAMSVNRLAPHCIATASLDQHVRLFDVRALASVVKQTAEAPYNYKGVDADDLEAAQTKAQFASSKARQACTSVDFSPRGDQLVGVSYDDVVKVWDMDPSWLYSDDGLKSKATVTKANGAAKGGRKSGAGVKKEDADEAPNGGLMKWLSTATPLKTEKEVQEAIKQEQAAPAIKTDRPEDVLAEPNRIPHNNQTGKWLTMFRAKWNQNPLLEPHFTIGSMTRRAEIYAADGTLLRTLWDENLVTAVPAVTCMHPVRPGRLVTGNASGRCTFWSPDA
ncbi:WD40 repeat [Kalmanozyma brasiliensis GHG001]|uniref:WD40 repeat n=1 Tax=Kalmanozyma brasiliensis (strain GHG001) TaxID=1365824 RepID=UPI0028682F99|nr:WD40 repeat [Kalmanozyma brasiliensis GHG001]KAF6767388.1 WD40 repeat [Kalmanozyma brasiliensis GHG001]